MIQLLPCPFCGGPAQEQPYKSKGWEIKCASCVIKYQQLTIRFTVPQLRERMAENWNKRTSLPKNPVS